MMWLLIAYSITFIAVAWILTTRNPTTAISMIVCTSLYNIPIFALGNSASAGIFPADAVLFAYLIRSLLSTRTTTPSRIFGNGYETIFYLLASYAVLRGAAVLLFDDYGYYNRFVLYGMYRWIFFAAAFYLFLKASSSIDYYTLLRNLAVALIAYFTGAIAHQSGIIDLSGWSAIGAAAGYDVESIARDVFRAYLGGNAAVVGCISVFGLVIAILAYQANPKIAIILFTLASISLIGGGSRSDIIATIGAVAIWLLAIARPKHAMRTIALMAPASIVVTLFFTLSDSYGITRLLDTDILGETSGTSEGTFAYRTYWWPIIVEHMTSNFGLLAFGNGPNAFRMFSVDGITTMNYGHNLLVHTLGELGLVGLLLLLAFIVNLLLLQRYSHKLSTQGRTAISLAMFFILQRTFSGIGVDSIFAVDNMLPITMSVIFVITAVLHTAPSTSIH